MLMNNEIRERLVKLNKEELVVLRDRVKCFDNPEERKKLNRRYNEINNEIRDIVYVEEIENDDYYGIPEIKKNIEEMAALEHEYYVLKTERRRRNARSLSRNPARRWWSLSMSTEILLLRIPAISTSLLILAFPFHALRRLGLQRLEFRPYR